MKRINRKAYLNLLLEESQKDLYSNIDELKELPIDVQKDIADHLINYDEVTVTREYGKFEVSNSSCLKRYYASDHKVWYFKRETVEQISELNEIIKKGKKEYEEWCNTHDVNWEALNN